MDVCGVPSLENPDFNKTTNEKWVRRFGLRSDRVVRLMIVQGRWDFISSVGMPNLTLSDDPAHSEVFFVENMAHTDDGTSLGCLKRRVRPTVDEIRDVKLTYIKEWLKVE